jgi:hypothetical protein
VSFDRSPGSSSEDFDAAVLVGTVAWHDDISGDTITKQVTRLVPLTPAQVTQVSAFIANLVAQVKAAD